MLTMVMVMLLIIMVTVMMSMRRVMMTMMVVHVNGRRADNHDDFVSHDETGDHYNGAVVEHVQYNGGNGGALIF